MNKLIDFAKVIWQFCQSQWPRGPRRRSAAARQLRLWVRVPPMAWMFVCYECCVLSGKGLCDELITRPEESYRLWCIVMCDLDTSRMKRPWPALGRSATGKNNLTILGPICMSTLAHILFWLSVHSYHAPSLLRRNISTKMFSKSWYNFWVNLKNHASYL
jgi:hypothetical protein